MVWNGLKLCRNNFKWKNWKKIQDNIAKTSKNHRKDETKALTSPNSMSAGVGLRLHGNEVPWWGAFFFTDTQIPKKNWKNQKLFHHFTTKVPTVFMQCKFDWTDWTTCAILIRNRNHQTAIGRRKIDQDKIEETTETARMKYSKIN